ncbi:condensin subunit ScpA [Catalinimonas alkaloidigena]|uniref:Segregation and condensation protein A n=1 Tax=Catalinimonas alkaloidigena TaxID=1075417 RepID=A0A1G9ESG9_9BACT|nr:segregation/condensation protein A [Catalinimonas alkaloidigena]SDK78935.1 condensin subunit ScpA [Catalinimonas alkaloidigena]
MNFEVKLPIFEGPFDLLLFFIERDELDIYDIPIAHLTNEFLEYLRKLEAFNLEVASEFILVAATLMRIKAKLLLPRKETNEMGEEVDPREELTRRLLEYRKYKSVMAEFSEREAQQALRETRGNASDEIERALQAIDAEAEWQHLNLYQLMRVYHRTMRRYDESQQQNVHVVKQYEYTIEGQKTKIMDKIGRQPVLTFTQLLEEYKSRLATVFNFLAILELLQTGHVMIQLEAGYNNFLILKAA